MKKNLGSTDRIIRVVGAFLIAFLLLTGTVSGTVGIILGVAGAIFLATSLVSVCPLYLALGISTCATKE